MTANSKPKPGPKIPHKRKHRAAHGTQPTAQPKVNLGAYYLRKSHE